MIQWKKIQKKCINTKKEAGYSFTIEDGEAVITIFRPLSGELLNDKKYLVIYEDAHGDVTLNFMTKEEMATIDGITENDLDDV